MTMLSLADAILKEDEGLILQQIQYTPLNELDEYGFTPLIEAAIIDNAHIAALLIEYGADCNLQDMTGGTALHWAAENNNVKLVNLLLKHGANPNAYAFSGQPVLTMPFLRREEPMKKQLITHGASIDFTQDYINAKLLGHMFELVGTADIVDPHNQFVELDFEGFYLEFSLAIIAESLDQFNKHFSARKLRPYEKHIQWIIDVIHRSAQLAKYQQYRTDIKKHQSTIDSLLQQEPLLMPIGYEGHAITFIKAGNILIKCDRREESRLYDNIVFYTIRNPKKLSMDFIKNLIYTKQSSEFINVELPILLDLQPETELKITAQISGNCSWANVEATIPALFFLLFSQADDFQRNASQYKNKALTLYHQWREWNKSRSLHFCIQSLMKASPIRKICKLEIIAAILFQSCKQDNYLDQERIDSILPLLTEPTYDYILKNYIKTYCYEDAGEEGRRFMRLLKHAGYIS